MKSFYKLVIGIIISLITYFPIMTVVNAPFYYLNNRMGAPAAILVAITTVLQIIIGIIISSRKENLKNLGIGMVIGALSMVFFAVFLTPMFWQY